MRSFWRWSMACVVPTVVGAAVWLAFEWGLRWDRATAAAVGIGISAVVLAPMAWWASREPKSSGPPVVAPRTQVGIDGVMGGSVIVGDHNMLSTTPAAAPPDRIGVGEGGGSRRPQMIRAYEQAGGVAALGTPRAAAVRGGGGYVQTFDRDDLHSFVMWAPPQGGCVVVPESAWEALCTVGDPRGESEWPELAGFPLPPGPDTTVVDDRTLEIPLGGGGWQLGTLTRTSPSHRWLWYPEPRHDDHASHATRWERNHGFEMRSRAIVDIAWHGAPEPKPLGACLQALLKAAEAGHFNHVFDVLGACYGVTLTAPRWNIAKDSNNNWARGIHITALLTDTDGNPAARGDVMLQVPGESYPHSLLGCVDLHVNITSLTRMLEAGGAVDVPSRLSLATVLRLLDAEIDTAAQIVPGLVIDDPDDVRFAMPPFVVTKVETGAFGTDDPPPCLVLADVIDLSALGEPTKTNNHREMTIRIIGARGQEVAQRREFLLEELIKYAFAWGYTSATRDALTDAFDHVAP